LSIFLVLRPLRPPVAIHTDIQVDCIAVACIWPRHCISPLAYCCRQSGCTLQASKLLSGTRLDLVVQGLPWLPGNTRHTQQLRAAECGWLGLRLVLISMHCVQTVCCRHPPVSELCRCGCR
jgi:hypothetical protein